MTLIAGIKFGNEAIVISDFRVTDGLTGVQNDVLHKFVLLDNRMAFYCSGSLASFEMFYRRIQGQQRNVTYENIDQEDGPAANTLRGVFSILPREENHGLSVLGIHLASGDNPLKMFRFKMYLAQGDWLLNTMNDEDFDWDIIGSGAIVAQDQRFPDRVELDLSGIFGRLYRQDHDLLTIAECIERVIKERLNALGDTIYEEAGISRVFNLTLIDGQYLKVVGRTAAEGNSVYTHERLPTGEVVLRNETTNQTITVGDFQNGERIAPTDQTFEL